MNTPQLSESSWKNPVTDNETVILTVGDLRRFLEGIPDDVQVFEFFADQAYRLMVEHKIQQCMSDRGQTYDVTGLIFQMA